MGSYIKENKDRLSIRHYVQLARGKNYWHEFTQKRLQSYIDRFDGRFCIVVNGSKTENDAYILPFCAVKDLFPDDALDRRNRWMGDIKDDTSCIRRVSESLNVQRYHNAFKLLEENIPICADLPEAPHLANRVPTTISRILRDSILVLRLKQKYGFRCQLCETRLGLPDGFFYCEAHHIRPLGAPHNGPDDASNVVIVCPNHHVLLDYGGIPLSRDSLRLRSHTISRAHIEYHNTTIHKGA